MCNIWVLTAGGGKEYANKYKKKACTGHKRLVYLTANNPLSSYNKGQQKAFIKCFLRGVA